MADTLAKQALKQEEVMAVSLSKCEAKEILKRNILKVLVCVTTGSRHGEIS